MNDLVEEDELLLELPSAGTGDEALGPAEPLADVDFLDVDTTSEEVGLDDASGNDTPLSGRLLDEYLLTPRQSGESFIDKEGAPSEPVMELGDAVDASGGEYGWLDATEPDNGGQYDVDFALSEATESYLHDGGTLAIDELLSMQEFESELAQRAPSRAQDDDDHDDMLIPLADDEQVDARLLSRGLEQVTRAAPAQDESIQVTETTTLHGSSYCVAAGQGRWWLWGDGLRQLSLGGIVGPVILSAPQEGPDAVDLIVNDHSPERCTAFILDRDGYIWRTDTQHPFVRDSLTPTRKGAHAPALWLGPDRLWLRTADGALFTRGFEDSEWGAASLPQAVIAAAPGSGESFSVISQPEGEPPSLMVTTDSGAEWHTFPLAVPDLDRLPTGAYLASAGVRLLLSFPGETANALRCPRPGIAWQTLVPRHQLGPALLPKPWPARSFRVIRDGAQDLLLLSSKAGKSERTWVRFDSASLGQAPGEELDLSVIHDGRQTHILVKLRSTVRIYACEEVSPPVRAR